MHRRVAESNCWNENDPPLAFRDTYISSTFRLSYPVHVRTTIRDALCVLVASIMASESETNCAT